MIFSGSVVLCLNEHTPVVVPARLDASKAIPSGSCAPLKSKMYAGKAVLRTSLLQKQPPAFVTWSALDNRGMAVSLYTMRGVTAFCIQ